MKTVRKTIALVTALACVFGLLWAPVRAEAAESKTWYVVYDEGNDRWAASSDNKASWSDTSLSSFADGDNLVIDGGGFGKSITLTTDKSIGELAFTGTGACIVYAKKVNHMYAVNGATGIVNADVVNADAYPGNVLQINGNVGTFTGHYEDGKVTAFAVTGTVDKAQVLSSYMWPNSEAVIYNVAAGKLMTNSAGNVIIEEQYYSTTATASIVTADSKAQGKTLDKVPATGEDFDFSKALIFFMLAGVFAVGAVCYRKKAN